MRDRVLNRRRLIQLGVLGVLGPMLPSYAQDRATLLRIIVPFNAGSGADAAARALGNALTEAAGLTVIVENRAGGATVIGSQEVARAAADGNTILYTTGGHTTNAVLMKKLPYDSLNGFTPIAMLTRTPGWVLVVGPNSRFKTLKQFLDAAKKDPGKLTFGSSGVGGSSHVMGALFCKAANIDLTHVPYKGTPFTDLFSGVIDSSFQGSGTVMQYLKDGRLRALGISSAKRVAQLPDVPTFGEFGINADLPAWSGIFGPPNLPPAVVQRLSESLHKAQQVPSYVKFVTDNGSEVVNMGPQQFRTYVAEEIAQYRRTLPPLGIHIE